MNIDQKDSPRMNQGEGAYLVSQISALILATLFVSGAISGCLDSIESSEIALSYTSLLYFYTLGPVGLWLVTLAATLLLIAARLISSAFGRAMLRLAIFIGVMGFITFGAISVAIPLRDALNQITDLNSNGSSQPM